MIKKLDWDSNFFGYSVGQIEMLDYSNTLSEQLLQEAKNYKLVYIISDIPIVIPIEQMQLVDIRTRLCKKNLSYLNFNKSNLAQFEGSYDTSLEKLSLKSGLYSRFKKDPGFKNNEFENLYKKWIHESVNKNIADSIIIYKEANENIGGFVSLKFKQGYSEIGLIAVDENKRGKGIGLSLLNYVNNETIKNGRQEIYVTTQFENLIAMKLYSKAGYEIVSKKYIYHLWN